LYFINTVGRLELQAVWRWYEHLIGWCELDLAMHRHVIGGGIGDVLSKAKWQE
jgi:hypothetical protein